MFEQLVPYLDTLGIGLIILLWLFTKWIERKPQAQSVDFTASLMLRISALEDKLEDYRTEVSVVTTELHELKLVNRELEVRLHLMESAHQDSPVPMWLKDLRGVMLACNKAYEREFLEIHGKTLEDYIGNTDEEIWGAEVAEHFVQNDRWVASRARPWQGVEYVTDDEDNLVPYGVIKYPRYDGNVMVGVAGIAFPARIARLIHKEYLDKSKE